MTNKEIAQRYFNRYFPQQCVSEGDKEFKALVRVLDKVKEGRPKAVRCLTCDGTGTVTGEHHDIIEVCGTCLGKGAF